MSHFPPRFSLVFVILLLCIGCHSTDPVEPNPPKPSNGDSLHSLSLSGFNLRAPRTGEAYDIWYRYGSDSIWQLGISMPQIFAKTHDSSIFGGYFRLIGRLDSIAEIAMSIDRLSDRLAPASIFMRGQIVGTSDSIHVSLSSTASSGLGSFEAVNAAAIFISSTSDSNRAQHEFYLAKPGSSGLEPSLTLLPPPPSGWKYALWVVDSNFYPHHHFFYGTFASGDGHDSDSLNDGFPFPGGYRTNNLNVPGGYIEVTLEPVGAISSLPALGPSTFNILSFPLPRFISNGQVSTMKNVATTSMPSATISIRR